MEQNPLIKRLKEDMPKSSTTFKKGRNKTGGRKTGVVNKDKKQLREFLLTLAEEGEAKLKKELMKLSGKPFVDAYLNLLEYCTPKLARIEADINHAINTDSLTDDELLTLVKLYRKIEQDQPVPA